jgi:two-component system cell cycle response regulator
VELQAAPKVLLVDDDECVRNHLGAIIAAEGYEVATALDAETALASMQDDFAAIVILDVNMPGMNGLDLCRAIRRQSYPGYVYVMLHTAIDAEADILAGLEAGADDYLSKSTPKSQLVGRLRTAQRVLALEHSLRSALGEREQMAMTDVLTGAFNRRYLLQHLTHELGFANRWRSELSVLVLDFDHFSHVNDRYGHAAGDAVLIELVKRIQNSLRRNCDWSARLGGDEFVVVLPQTDIAGASVVAEKLLDNVQATPMSTGNGIVRMTVSIGASGLGAIRDRDSATAETLIELADQCLYKSKKTGRSRATIPEMMIDAHLREQQTNRHAIVAGT